MARIIVPGEGGALRAVEVDRELTIGRAADCDIVIAEASVSSHHLAIAPAPGGFTVRDLGSTNGTFINGQRIFQPATVHPGDQLRLGQAAIVIEGAPADGGGTMAAPPPGGTVVATVPAAGMAPPPPPPPPPPPVWRLVVRSGVDVGKEIPIEMGQEVTIGRATDSTLPLTDARVSTHHVRILRRADGLVITDLGSANGTLLRRVRIHDSGTGQPGDEIQVGETVIVAFVGDAAPDAYAPTPTIIELTPSAGLAASEVEAIVRKGSQGTKTAVYVVGAIALVGAAVAAFLLLRGGGGGDEDVVPAVVSRNDDATVQIINITDGGLIFTGSGTVIDREEGLILTNNHVASGGELYVFTKDLDEEVEAELVAAATCQDLALIRIKSEDDRDRFDEVELAPAGSLAQGDLVVAMGYPATAEGATGERLDSLSVTSGVVSKVDSVYDVPGSGLPRLTSVIQHEAAVNPGNSGGPLFDSEGRQVGVNTAIFFGSRGRVEGANYAVTIGRVRELLEDMKDGYSPGWFGASFDESGDQGLFVLGITPDSEASDLGFSGAVQGTDGELGYSFIVTEVDGQPITTLASYCDAIPEEPGTVELTVANSTEEVVIEVFIGER